MLDRRLCAWIALVSAFVCMVGLTGVDRALAEWIRASGVENAPFFTHGLATLDRVSGIHVWLWLAGTVALAVGAIGLAMRRRARWPAALMAAGIVQFATLLTMMLAKPQFGRLRPHQVLESGDWTHVWFAGGGSFPSGHVAFYFGLLVPLAAACSRVWQRTVVLALGVFVAAARLDLAAHFLSDVAASALLAALFTLLLSALARAWFRHASDART